MSFADSVAIVTGGASGIGLALGQELRRRGARVVVVDIDKDAAERVAEELGGDAHGVDVCDRDAVGDMVSHTREKHGRIDYIFNNAGIAVGGEVRHTPMESWYRVLDVNLRGVVHGVDAAYPIFIEQGFGHIVNTASIAGLIPCPGLVAYSASKHAVVGLSTGLRAEAARYGVRVSAVCPGFVKTQIMDNAAVHGISREKAQSGIPWTDVDDCAREILDGVARNKAVIVVTRHGKVLSQLNRLAPSAMHWVSRRLHSRQSKQGVH